MVANSDSSMKTLYKCVLCDSQMVANSDCSMKTLYNLYCQSQMVTDGDYVLSVSATLPQSLTVKGLTDLTRNIETKCDLDELFTRHPFGVLRRCSEGGHC